MDHAAQSLLLNVAARLALICERVTILVGCECRVSARWSGGPDL
jgi:hypothetical protein